MRPCVLPCIERKHLLLVVERAGAELADARGGLEHLCQRNIHDMSLYAVLDNPDELVDVLINPAADPAPDPQPSLKRKAPESTPASDTTTG